MAPSGEASWPERTNDRYRRQVARRRQAFEQRQRWLFEHRDRPVAYGGRRYVVRLRRRHRSFRDSGATWLQWLLHGLRNLIGDVIRLVSARRSHWSVAILDQDVREGWIGVVVGHAAKDGNG